MLSKFGFCHAVQCVNYTAGFTHSLGRKVQCRAFLHFLSHCNDDQYNFKSVCVVFYMHIKQSSKYLNSGMSPKSQSKVYFETLKLTKKVWHIKKEASLLVHRKSRVPRSAYLRGQRVHPPFFTMEISFNVLKNGKEREREEQNVGVSFWIFMRLGKRTEREKWRKSGRKGRTIDAALSGRLDYEREMSNIELISKGSCRGHRGSRCSILIQYVPPDQAPVLTQIWKQLKDKWLSRTLGGIVSNRPALHTTFMQNKALVSAL